jgi:hypothetical protein
MMQQKTIKIALASGEVKEFAFSMSKSEPYFLEAEGYENRRLHATGGDLFDCLVNLRSDLEKEGAEILCNGARLDTYPSAMSREMSGGKKVYVLKKGEPANPKDLVNTFDEAPIEKIASVVDQRENYLEWIKSCER